MQPKPNTSTRTTSSYSLGWWPRASLVAELGRGRVLTTITKIRTSRLGRFQHGSPVVAVGLLDMGPNQPNASVLVVGVALQSRRRADLREIGRAHVGHCPFDVFLDHDPVLV